MANKIEKKELAVFVNKLLDKYEVIGPKKKKTQYVFDIISSPDDLELDYPTTILPLKKFLLPQKEKLITFNLDNSDALEEPNLERKQLLFGVHSCDLNSFPILDKVFIDENPCPRYAKRRENLILVALTCNEPNEYCFCKSMGTGPSPDSGYDLLLTDLGEEYLIESGSEVGEKLLSLIEGKNAEDADLKRKESIIESAEGKFERQINTKGLPEIFQKNLDHPIWMELGKKDLACAQCIHSCPTCYCYDVRDDINLNIDSSTRYREWDSCFLKEFAEVAMEGNYRKDRSSRVRQFIGHNLGWGGAEQYQIEEGRVKCVGCGRCIRACPVDIDITEVAAIIRGDK